jgi:hypothetical protein
MNKILSEETTQKWYHYKLKLLPLAEKQAFRCQYSGLTVILYPQQLVVFSPKSALVNRCVSME